MRGLIAATAVALAVAPAAVLAQDKQPSGKPAAPADAVAQRPAAGPPDLDARAWILVDPRDGTVLASKAANRRRPIASATKLMTAYLALNKLDPRQSLRAAPYSAGSVESVLGLRTGEKMRVSDLLYALMLPSANDAAATLATGVAGSVPRFVAQMNRQARALGLTETSYSTPVGLDAPDNYSSASDLAQLAIEDLENPLFSRIVDTPSTVLRTGDHPRRITTRNTLLLEDPSVDGIKTGHTQGAGYVLVGSATRDGTRLVSAVLGAPSEAARDAETEELLGYGFSLYKASQPVERGEEVADPKLDYREERLGLVARRGIEVSVRDGQRIETAVEAPDEVSGAIEEGERFGSVVVSVDGRIAGRSPLVAAESVGAASTADKVLSTVQNPLVLVPVGAFVILLGLLLALRGRGPTDTEPAERPAAADPEPWRPERRNRDQARRDRTPEERRKMHEERIRRRRERRGRA